MIICYDFKVTYKNIFLDYNRRVKSYFYKKKFQFWNIIFLADGIIVGCEE